MALVIGYLLIPCASDPVRQRWQQDPQQLMSKSPCLAESHPIHQKWSLLPKWFSLLTAPWLWNISQNCLCVHSVQENVSWPRWNFSSEKPARMITLIASKQKNHLGLQRPVLEASGTAGLKQRLFCTSPPQQSHLHLRFTGGRMETTETLLSLAVGAECHQKKN